MSHFDNKSEESSNREAIKNKLFEAIMAYKNMEYQKSATAFEDYFKMKKEVSFPELEKDDHLMKLNLANAKQYSSNYHGAVSIYKSLSKKHPTWNAPYLMNAICQHKLGNIEESKFQWELARRFGNDIAQNPFEEEIEKF